MLRWTLESDSSRIKRLIEIFTKYAQLIYFQKPDDEFLYFIRGDNSTFIKERRAIQSEIINNLMIQIFTCYSYIAKANIQSVI